MCCPESSCPLIYESLLAVLCIHVDFCADLSGGRLMYAIACPYSAMSSCVNQQKMSTWHLKGFVCDAQAEKKAEKAAAAAAAATADVTAPAASSPASVQPGAAAKAASPIPKAADTAAGAPAASRLASSIAKPGNTASPTASSWLEPRLSGGTREGGREGSDPPPASSSRQPALASSAPKQVPSRMADGSRDAEDSAVRRGGEDLGLRVRQRSLAIRAYSR